MIQQRQRLLDAFLEKLGRGEGELPEPLGFEMGNDEIQPFGDKAQLLRNANQNSKFLQMLWIHYTRKGHLYVWPEIEETRALHFIVHTTTLLRTLQSLPPDQLCAPPRRMISLWLRWITFHGMIGVPITDRFQNPPIISDVPVLRPFAVEWRTMWQGRTPINLLWVMPSSCEINDWKAFP